MGVKECLGTISNPAAESFQWVLRDSLFNQFIQGQTVMILQVTGKPGCGKSVLAKYLYEKATASIQEAQRPKLLFFACKDTDKERNTPISILGSVISQILEMEEAIPEFIFKKKGKSSEDIAKALEEKGIIGKKVVGALDKIEWEYKDLLEIFVQLLERQQQPFLCILDALDECEHSPDRDRLKQTIARQFCKSTPGKHKIILTNRNYHNLRFRGSIANTIDLDREPAMDTDIMLFIRTEVCFLVEERPAYRTYQNLIIQSLESRADKMYLLVKLLLSLLPDLTNSSLRSVRSILQSLPSTLSQIYENIWDEIMKKNGERAELIMEWLVCAFRPLTIEEFKMAIAWQELAHENVASISDGLQLRGLLEELAPGDLPGDLQRLFGPLIHISDSEVQLSHQTVKEWLLRHSGIQTQHAHSRIGEICARTIDGAPDGMKNGSFESLDSIVTIVGGDVVVCPELLGYAARYWTKHSQEASQQSNGYRLKLRQFRRS